MKLGGILGKSKDFREVWVLTQPLKTSRSFQLKFKISRGSNFAEDISSGTFFPNDPNRPCGGEFEPGGGIGGLLSELSKFAISPVVRFILGF